MSQIEKIAIVWESETGGGVNNYLKYLLQSKAFEEKKITIFTNSENKGAKPLIKDFEKQKNINFVFFSSFFIFDRKRSFLEKSIYYFLKPFFLLLAIYRFKKILSNLKFDVLLCMSGGYGNFQSQQAAILAADKSKISVRSIVMFHACVKPPLFMGFIFRIIHYFMAKTLTSLISVSKATEETILDNSSLLNDQRLETKIIYPGVPKNQFVKKNYLNLKKLENNEFMLKIGMISRLDPDKGHEDLIIAFSKLPIDYKKKMSLIFIGEDVKGHKTKLKKIVSNLNLEKKIEFSGYVEIDSKKIILSLDLLISLSKYEGFGLSIAESMSVGTPVLVTAVGGVNELVTNDCGKLIRYGQIKAIKDSLIDFCDHKEDWDHKAQIAKDRIEKYFTSEIMGNNYMSHLSSKFN